MQTRSYIQNIFFQVLFFTWRINIDSIPKQQRFLGKLIPSIRPFCELVHLDKKTIADIQIHINRELLYRNKYYSNRSTIAAIRFLIFGLYVKLMAPLKIYIKIHDPDITSNRLASRCVKKKKEILR